MPRAHAFWNNHRAGLAAVKTSCVAEERKPNCFLEVWGELELRTDRSASFFFPPQRATLLWGDPLPPPGEERPVPRVEQTVTYNTGPVVCLPPPGPLRTAGGEGDPQSWAGGGSVRLETWVCPGVKINWFIFVCARETCRRSGLHYPRRLNEEVNVSISLGFLFLKTIDLSVYCKLHSLSVETTRTRRRTLGALRVDTSGSERQSWRLTCRCLFKNTSYSRTPEICKNWKHLSGSLLLLIKVVTL